MRDSNQEGNTAELSAAVERTGGLQPWRRLFHAVNGTLVVGAITLLGVEVRVAALVLGGMLAVLLAMDLTRLSNSQANILFFKAFSLLASPREARGIASSTWYAVSVVLVLLLFPRTYALGGILVLAWADPAANLVGRAWGRKPFLGGTILGSVTFAVVAFGALLLFVPWPAALATALVTTVVEAAPTGLDDNLILPLTAAGALLLIGIL